MQWNKEQVGQWIRGHGAEFDAVTTAFESAGIDGKWLIDENTGISALWAIVPDRLRTAIEDMQATDANIASGTHF